MRLARLADPLRRRNDLDAEIAALIGRPALAGQIGEFIASEVFGIAHESAANNAGFDGVFRDGPLAGKSVNVKLYGKREGILDLNPQALPNLFLVLAGPRIGEPSSQGRMRPLAIAEVFLFDAPALVARLP